MTRRSTLVEYASFTAPSLRDLFNNGPLQERSKASMFRYWPKGSKFIATRRCPISTGLAVGLRWSRAASRQVLR